MDIIPSGITRYTMRSLYVTLSLSMLLLYSCQEANLPVFDHPEFIGSWRVHERGEFYQNDTLEFTSARFFTLQLIDDEHGKFTQPGSQSAIDFLYAYLPAKDRVVLAPLSADNFEVPTDTYTLEQKGDGTMTWKTVLSFVTVDGDHTKHLIYWNMIKL